MGNQLTKIVWRTVGNIVKPQVNTDTVCTPWEKDETALCTVIEFIRDQINQQGDGT